MFILYALIPDKRFHEELLFVEATIKLWQRDMKANMTTAFPLDLEIEEIGVTIEERSDNYTVGDKVTPPKIQNLYARMMESEDKPVVRATRNRNNSYSKQGSHSQSNNTSTKNTQTCEACLGVGHCITNTDTVCYHTAKTSICAKFIDNPSNNDLVKSNTYR